MNTKILKSRSGKGFSFLASINRPVVPSHVTKMSESINKMGVIRPVIISNIDFISGKSENYIIDGQHLYLACMRSNIDIPYIELEIKDKEDLIEKIALSNNSSKSWTLIDYILAWSSLKDDYKKLMSFYEIYDLELSQIAYLFHNGFIPSSRVNIASVIKKGLFKIKNEEHCVIILDYITDLLRVIPRMNRSKNCSIISAFVEIYKSNESIYTTGRHTRFIKKVEKNKDKFILVTQDDEKIKEILNNFI